MMTLTESFTAEQSSDWDYYNRWYLNNGWVCEEARNLLGKTSAINILNLR